MDLKNKESALEIDRMCHKLNNYSHGLQYYTGIQKYDKWYMYKTFKTYLTYWQNLFILRINKINKQKYIYKYLIYLISFIEQDTWIQTVNQIIKESQTERSKSYQLRTNAEALMIKITQEIWDAWNNTNNVLAHRSSELLEAKNKLQQHLQMVEIILISNFLIMIIIYEIIIV